MSRLFSFFSLKFIGVILSTKFKTIDAHRGVAVEVCQVRTISTKGCIFKMVVSMVQWKCLKVLKGLKGETVMSVNLAQSKVAKC